VSLFIYLNNKCIRHAASKEKFVCYCEKLLIMIDERKSWIPF